MSGFVLHPDALTDLTEIWEYIATDNPDAADRVLEEIRDAIRRRRVSSSGPHPFRSDFATTAFSSHPQLWATRPRSEEFPTLCTKQNRKG